MTTFVSSSKELIGIIAAMEAEVEALKQALIDCKTELLAGVDVYLGTIGGHKVAVMQCGMGKVSAAAGAQALITRYDPACIINTGCAGALRADLKIGDIVIADSAVEWDLDLLALGLPRGFISALNAVEMKADTAIGDRIAAAMPENAHIVRGLVVSGDQFVDSDAKRSIILGSFPEALCAEMEGAAIGHVCTQNDVPFCIVRAMSDTADGDSSVNFAEFSAQAGRDSAAVLIHMFNM